jgi:hypothetical protein
MGADAQFVSATNLSCRQGPSPAIHEFVVDLIQTAACIHANDGTITADAVGFFDQMTEMEMTDAIHVTGEPKSAQAMEQLQKFILSILWSAPEPCIPRKQLYIFVRARRR